MRAFSTLLLCLLFICATSVLGAVSHAESWTPQIGQQLLTPGWENYSPQPIESIIGYRVYFVELDANVINDFSSHFNLETSNDPAEGWAVTHDAELLGQLAIIGSGLDLGLSRSNKQESAIIEYSSWLLTMGNLPLRVSLSEANVKTMEANTLLGIQLTPQTIDYQNQRIETQIDFELSNQNGHTNQVDIVAWINEICLEPIAVVSQLLEKGKENQIRYFAFYLDARVLSQEMIPSGSPILSMGNISGFQQVFGTQVETQKVVEPGKLEVGLCYREASLGGYLSGSHSITDKAIIAGNLEFRQNQLMYLIGLRFNLHENLSFLASAKDKTGNLLPIVQLGIGDEVWPIPNLKLSLDLFLLDIDSTQLKIAKTIKVDLGCTYFGKGWSLAYTAGLVKGKISQGVQGTIRIFDKFDLAMTYNYFQPEEHRVSLGIVFSRF